MSLSSVCCNVESVGCSVYCSVCVCVAVLFILRARRCSGRSLFVCICLFDLSTGLFDALTSSR